MPHLRTITFTFVDVEAVQRILASIRVPLSLDLGVSMAFKDISEVFLPTVDVAENFPSVPAAYGMTISPGNDGHSIRVSLNSKTGGTSQFIATGSLDDDDIDNITVPVLTSLGRLPLPNLASLTIEGMEGEYNITIALCRGLFEQIPSIASISLNDCSSAFAEALAITPTLQLCPRLESIQLESLTIGRESLLKILKSRTIHGPHAHLFRARGGVYLRNVRFSYYEEVGPGLLKAIEALGVDVEFEAGKEVKK